MSINDPGETTAKARRTGPDPGFLGALCSVALIAVVAGAGGSVGLMLRSGHHPSRLLIVLFAIWVLSPFVALAFANIGSKGWSVLTRATLYIVTLVITAASLAIYGYVLLRPPKTAFVWVVVPPASWLLMATVVPIAALISRRMCHCGRDRTQR